MLTVKVMRVLPELPNIEGGTGYIKPCRFSTKIVEADEVEIHTHRPGELYSVEGSCKDGSSFAFYISDSYKPKPEGFADEVVFWYAAYIENSNGATTEVVKF